MVKFPDSMGDCIYFTRRTFENNGKAIAWVYRKPCPKCRKATMSKPLDSKTGKARIRAETYECPTCHYSEEKAPHEESLNVEIMFTCPHCSYKGEATTQYKRRNWDGVKAYTFACSKCNKTLGLTKKMKERKSRKGLNVDEAVDD